MKKHHYKLDTGDDTWGKHYFGYLEQTMVFKCTKCDSELYIQRSTFNSFVVKEIQEVMVVWPAPTSCSEYLLYTSHVMRKADFYTQNDLLCE